ncbi:hypothetical protein DNTS_025553 [Danionella cerebrum]|uniref:Uncharacterized protein n=1 Tax=Danionella cerebrum TaxID=2873325 RepID=A0A553Q968_9TELE|nr:hypothetical protein DNTS_025553 [Danionella translucida]
MADLSLSDALTDGADPENREERVERDFVSALEAESFEDQVGETVNKSDFIPLLDEEEVGKKGSVVDQAEQECEPGKSRLSSFTFV